MLGSPKDRFCLPVDMSRHSGRQAHIHRSRDLVTSPIRERPCRDQSSASAGIAAPQDEAPGSPRLVGGSGGGAPRILVHRLLIAYVGGRISTGRPLLIR